MELEHTEEETPEDEMVHVPLASARTKRFIATTGLLVAVTSVLGYTSRRAGLAVSSLLSVSRDPVSSSGIPGLVLLLIVTFTAVILLIASWKRPALFERAPTSLWRTVEALAIVFGLVVLLVWIPYLMLEPLALNPYFSEGDFRLLSWLDLWVIYCAPFIVGFTSIHRVGKIRYGLLAAVLAILLSFLVYTHLIEWASPPLFSSQLELNRQYILAQLGPLYSSSVDLAVTLDIFTRYPSAVPPAHMLLFLVMGLGLGRATKPYAGRALRFVKGGRITTLAIFLTILTLVVGFTVTPLGEIQEVKMRSIPDSNLSRTHMRSWIDPTSLSEGNLSTGHLEVVPSWLVGLSGTYWSRYVDTGWSGGGGKPIKESYYRYTFDIPHYDSPLAKSPTSINLSKHTPILLCWRASVMVEPERRLTKLWIRTIPKESLNRTIQVTPCLYRSKLAFKVDPPAIIAEMRVVYYTQTDHASSFPLRRADKRGSLYVPLGGYVTKKMKKAGIKDPRELWEWDSEKQCLDYAERTIFFVAGKKSETYVLSSVYTT